jgi:hypothetical protein
MTKRRIWKDDEIKAIFTMRSNGNTQGAIAQIMGTSNWTISQILRRLMRPDVEIDAGVLASVNKMPRPRKKPVIDGSAPTNPAIPQAMKAADPAYAKKELFLPAANTANMLPDLPPPPTLGDWLLAQEERADNTANLFPDLPAVPMTKAAALQAVLTNVELANKARAQVREARAVWNSLQKEADEIEAAAFEHLQGLEMYGFTAEFLSAFLDQCGLGDDGLPTNE